MRTLFWISLVVLAALGFVVGKAYKTIWGDNSNPESISSILYIPHAASLQQVMDSLEQNAMLASIVDFSRTAKLMKFTDASVKSGRYDIASVKTNRELISKLRLGEQDPIDVIINDGRTLKEVCEKIAVQLDFSADTLYNYLTSPAQLEAWATTKENVVGRLVPDTYQMYWNSSPAKFCQRMEIEYDKYWNADRKAKLDALGLTAAQATTLASVVEKESNYNPEKPRIAGVYINRIKRGIPLQADPTVVFATGIFDLKRVLNKHLEFDSPYNTYMYPGLPPGPICLPSKPSIDAVLNVEEHNFLYFCAKTDYSGQHDFAKTLTEHNNNGKRYHAWLNKQGIR